MILPEAKHTQTWEKGNFFRLLCSLSDDLVRSSMRACKHYTLLESDILLPGGMTGEPRGGFQVLIK